MPNPLGSRLALALILSVSMLMSLKHVSAEVGIKTLLPGKMYSCEDYLFYIRFNKNGGVTILNSDALEVWETEERVPPASVYWEPMAVTIRRKSFGTIKIYVGTGANPQLLADISGGGIYTGVGHGVHSADGHSVTGTTCEISKKKVGE